MSGEDLVFTIVAVLTVLSALYAVTTHYLLRSIVALGAFLTALSAEFYLLGADYVAVIQIFVYVGGVVVLMLFALMLSASGERHPLIPTGGRALGAVVAYVLAAGLIWAVTTTELAPLQEAPNNSVAALGSVLLSRHLLAFEIIGVILVAALVAALAIVRGERQ